MSKSLRTNSIQGIQQVSLDFIKSLRVVGKAENTVKNYKTDLDVFIRFLEVKGLTQFDLGKFSIEHALEYDHYLSKIYTSDNSKRRRVQSLRLFFDYLVQEFDFPNNPIRKIAPSPKKLNLPTPPSYSNIAKVWNELRIDQDIESISDLICFRNQIIFALIYECALQVSELEKVEISHILGSENQNRLMIMSQKRDPYSIPLSEHLSKIINVYIKSYKKMCNDKGIKNKNYLLFNANAHTIVSGKVSARGIELNFENWSKLINETMSAKNLRQAGILKWIQKGIPQSQIKEWMGVAPSYSLKLYEQVLNIDTYLELF